MIFSEIYSAYYNTVARLIKAAVNRELDKESFKEIIEKNAFGIDKWNIKTALDSQKWRLIQRKDYSSPIKNPPTMPLTILEKRWLKAIYSDPRIKLFTDEDMNLDDVDPLFTPDVIKAFDKYSDGDNYGDKTYVKNFRTILDAINNGYPLSIESISAKGRKIRKAVQPDRLEYSEKDDKFRLICSDKNGNGVINLGKILNVDRYDRPLEITQKDKMKGSVKRKVEFIVTDEKNALERVMMHFAHFSKQTERIEENKYKVIMTYDKEDETEIVIRIMSFGPLIKVTGPPRVADQIIKRLINQKSCEI